MKVLGRESLTAAAVLVTAFLPINAQTASDTSQNNTDVVLEDACIPVHETLKELGAEEFSKALMARKMDFKYGKFTIFAPSDLLLKNEGLILADAGHTNVTINDILLFHVSAQNISENITDPNHCGKHLLMLNEDLHVDQEKSVTACEDGKVFQIGPGNVGPQTLPEVIGDPVQACDSVIYSIGGSLMMPSLPNVTVAPVAPTEAPAPTKAPTRQEAPVTVAPVLAPTEAPSLPVASGSNTILSSKGSLAFVALVSLIVSIL